MQSTISVENNLSDFRKSNRIDHIFRGLFPHDNISKEVATWRRKNVRFAFPGFLRFLRTRLSGGKHFIGKLSFALVDQYGRETDFGLVSLDLVTDAGAAYIVNAFLGSTSVSSLRYHGLGSSNSSLLVTNTALTTELASSYTTTNVRSAGTVALGDANNIMTSIALTSFTSTVACREWGLFSQASILTGTPVGGTLFDRVTFATQNVLVTFSAKTTFILTVSSGS